MSSRCHRTASGKIELGRLAAIVESSEDAIYAKSLEASSLLNRGAERLLAIPPMNYRQVCRPTVPAEHLQKWRKLALIKQGRVIRSVETRRATAMAVMDFCNHLSVKDSEGRMLALRIARDITERVRSEQERHAVCRRKTARAQPSGAAAPDRLAKRAKFSLPRWTMRRPFHVAQLWCPASRTGAPYICSRRMAPSDNWLWRTRTLPVK